MEHQTWWGQVQPLLRTQYASFHLLVTEQLKKTVSDNIIVYKNLVPVEYMELDPYTGLVAADKRKKIIRMQPRLGAF